MQEMPVTPGCKARQHQDRKAGDTHAHWMMVARGPQHLIVFNCIGKVNLESCQIYEVRAALWPLSSQLPVQGMGVRCGILQTCCLTVTDLSPSAES